MTRYGFNQENYRFRGKEQTFTFTRQQYLEDTSDMELAKFAPGDIRLLSVHGQKIRLLLKGDKVFDLHYPSTAALDHDLREWAARSGHSVEQLLAKGENDINGFGP
jgi:hypothetical protein